MRLTLQTYLKTAEKQIALLNPDQIKFLFRKILEKCRQRSIEDGNLNPKEESNKRLKHLFSLGSGQIYKDNTSDQKSNCATSTWCDKLFNGVGFIVGGASAYVYFTLAESAALFLCDNIGIQDGNARNVLKYFIASLSVIPWGSLGAEATQSVFGKVYNFFGSCKKSKSCRNGGAKKCAVAATSIIGGSFSAAPPTYLAIQALQGSPWYSQLLLLIPAFLGPASIRILALARLIDEGVSWLSSFCKENPNIKRTKLIEVIECIINAITRLPKEQLQSLFNEVQGDQRNLSYNVPDDENNTEKTPLISLVGSHL